MKLRTLIALAAAALIATSAAAAGTHAGPGPGPGQGSRATRSRAFEHGRHGSRGPAGAQACRGRSLLLGGVYVSGSAGADGTGSFVLDVKRASRLGKRLVGTQVTVSVDARTRFHRGGRATLADLQANDLVGVVARACKPAAASDAPVITARLVVAHAPQATL